MNRGFLIEGFVLKVVRIGSRDFGVFSSEFKGVLRVVGDTRVRQSQGLNPPIKALSAIISSNQGYQSNRIEKSFRAMQENLGLDHHQKP